ncbi:hypothetical protein [Lysinibacillus xylanilyticus]
MGQHDVGYSVVATGRGVLRLSSFISADVYPLKEVNKNSLIRAIYLEF